MGLKCPLLPELQFCLCGVIVNTLHCFCSQWVRKCVWWDKCTIYIINHIPSTTFNYSLECIERGGKWRQNTIGNIFSGILSETAHKILWVKMLLYISSYVNLTYIFGNRHIYRSLQTEPGICWLIMYPESRMRLARGDTLMLSRETH